MITSPSRLPSTNSLHGFKLSCAASIRWMTVSIWDPFASTSTNTPRCATTKKVAFSQREIEVLHYMSDRAGKVVTREELLRNVWGYQNVPLTRSVDNLVARLHWKVEPDPD